MRGSGTCQRYLDEKRNNSIQDAVKDLTFLGDAVKDIREKVVEEPMYGRAVTDGQESPHWPEAPEAETFLGISTHTRDIEPQREQAQDIDLDR